MLASVYNMLVGNIVSGLPPRNVIDGNAALLSPSDMHLLRGKTFSRCRMFLLVCRGTMDVTIDGKHLTLLPDTLVDMFEKTELTFESFGEDCEAYCFLPTYSFVREALKTFRAGNDRYLWNRMVSPVVKLSAQNRKILEKQMELLTESFFSVGHHYRTELAQIYFKGFQMELGNMLLDNEAAFLQTDASFDHYDMLAMKFMNLMWEYALKEHKTLFYAEKIGVCSTHLIRIVKEKLGSTPHELLVEEILHHAVAMLECDNFSVQQISDQLHFADQSTFCKFFKKHKGVSPKQYREQQLLQKA